MPFSDVPLSASQLAQLIQSRVTLKVLGSVDSPVAISAESAATNRPKVLDAVRAAGWAPFHYDRAHDGIAEPWRAHVLWHQDCRKIAANFHQWFEGVKPSNKLPQMLSACGALVLVTWIPQFLSTGSTDEPNPQGAATETPEKQRQVDEEHLAAASATVQNLMLLLSADSMGTYWSSGGTFRTAAMFERLGIPSCERLLAAVFVEFPETTAQPLERLAGKQRANRSKTHQWMREIELSS